MSETRRILGDNSRLFRVRFFTFAALREIFSSSAPLRLFAAHDSVEGVMVMFEEK